MARRGKCWKTSPSAAFHPKHWSYPKDYPVQPLALHRPPKNPKLSQSCGSLGCHFHRAIFGQDLSQPCFPENRDPSPSPSFPSRIAQSPRGAPQSFRPHRGQPAALGPSPPGPAPPWGTHLPPSWGQHPSPAHAPPAPAGPSPVRLRCAPGLRSAAPLRFPWEVWPGGAWLSGRGLRQSSARADWAARPRPLPARGRHVTRRRRPARWTLEAQDGGGAGGGEGEGSGAAAPPAGPGRHRAAPDTARQRGAALRTAGAALRGRPLAFLPQRLPRPGLRAAAPTGPPGAEPGLAGPRCCPPSSGLPSRRVSPANWRD